MLLPPESEHVPSQMTFLDLNDDGREDAVYSNLSMVDFRDPAPLEIWLANESGTMDLVTEELIVGAIPIEEQGFRQHIAADFNGDGRLDLFLEATGPEPDCDDPPGAHNTCFPGGRNQLLLSGEDGKLYNVSETHLPDLKDFTHGATVGDFDRDGDADIWVNNSGAPLGDVQFSYLLHNDGQGRFEIAADNSLDGAEARIVGRNGILPDINWITGLWSQAIDADGDGDLDLAVGNNHTDPFRDGLDYINLLLQNNGNGTFTVELQDAWPNPTGFERITQAQDSMVYDLNLDGLDDLVWHQSRSDFSDSLLQALISNGDGTFRDETSTRIPRNPDAVAVSFDKPQLRDVDGDGHKDLVNWAQLPPGPRLGYVEILINDGEGYFRPLDQDWINNVINFIWVALDVDGDGGTDFFEGNILHKMIEPYGAELDGTSEDDRLIGGAYDNVYRGLEGDDVLDGGLGSDQLDGGPGNDRLIGGKGNDWYIYHTGDLAGHDTIIDKQGSDRLRFDSFGLDEVSLARKGDNGELILDFADGGSITVEGHFQSGDRGVEKLRVGPDTYDISRNPGFMSGSIADLLGLDQNGFEINAGLNGNWWNGLGRNGEGVQVEVSDGGDGTLILVATIYSYDDMGNQIFLIAVGTVNGDTAQVEVFITEGGRWGDNYDPALVRESQWGTGTFTASSCGAMHMSLIPNAEFQALGYTDLEYDLFRLTTPAALCPAENSN